MSCSPFDLKDFAFGELGERERAEVAAHLETCAACREELERLRLTQAMLLSLREEEPPRRIAFVSDKVFEPRWYHALWNSGPRLGFASSALLAAAILVHAFVPRPVVQQQPVPVAAATVNQAAVEARIQTEVGQRVDAAVRAALAQSEARQAQKTTQLVAATRQELEMQRRADRVAFQEVLTVMQKRYTGILVASSDLGGER